VNAVVNGAPREVEAPVGIAVAVNASVVRRGAFEEHLLHEGDEIEIIRAVSGG
jgi:thiamine biosynthesis protein ThiS